MLERSTQETENYAVSNKHSVGKIQDAISRLKKKDNRQQGDMAQVVTYPDRPGEPDCAYFLRTGSCGYGRDCRYNHPPYAAQATDQLRKNELPVRVGQPDCEYYLRTATCKYGSNCKYNHPKDRNGARPVFFNTLGLPIRQDEKPCPYYMRTGDCKFSVACKFHHPEPMSQGTHSSQSGPAAFGFTGSSTMPSMGLAYVGGYPTLSRTMCTPIPYIPGTQMYMPLIFSHSQGLGPSQGWNIYKGSNLVRNTKDESRYDCNSLKTDQQECRYIVDQEIEENKHEVSGKYDKPIEKKVRPVTDTIGPHGLPSRPGQAECSYYNMYGLCNLGLGCRYDHPFHGYPYIPPLYVLDPSRATYPRVSPAAVSSAMLSSTPKHPDFVHTSANNEQQNVDANMVMTDHPTEQIGSLQPQSSQASSKPST